MNISANFKRSEFKCNCGVCDFDTVDVELINVLQDIRDHFNNSVKVTSGNRCFNYNKSVGGADNSYHVRGRAVDIQVSNVQPQEVYNYLDNKYPNKFGLGSYSTFTHIDTRSGKGRWHGR